MSIDQSQPANELTQLVFIGAVDDEQSPRTRTVQTPLETVLRELADALKERTPGMSEDIVVARFAWFLHDHIHDCHVFESADERQHVSQHAEPQRLGNARRIAWVKEQGMGVQLFSHLEAVSLTELTAKTQYRLERGRPRVCVDHDRCENERVSRNRLQSGVAALVDIAEIHAERWITAAP